MADEWTWGADLYKRRRCKAIVAQASCSLGDKCTFAHSAAELKTWPWPEVLPQHWQGQVSIGVVEHAMFWDLPPLGTIDVVCNRSTCLGNPFGACCYDDPLQRPPADENGWRKQEHEVLVGAFDQYLQAVLEKNPSGSLSQDVHRIAEQHHLQLSEAWQLSQPPREEVRNALKALAEKVQQGARLRLLCHCRPHVRCHAESIKRHLDQFAVESRDAAAKPITPSEHLEGLLDVNGCIWPGSMTCTEACSVSTKSYDCQREPRALDPANMRGYCAQCWSHHSRVYHWPGFDDDWPKEYYFEDYVPSKSWGKHSSVRHCWFFERGCCKFGEHCPFSHKT